MPDLSGCWLRARSRVFRRRRAAVKTGSNSLDHWFCAFPGTLRNVRNAGRSPGSGRHARLGRGHYCRSRLDIAPADLNQRVPRDARASSAAGLSRPASSPQASARCRREARHRHTRYFPALTCSFPACTAPATRQPPTALASLTRAAPTSSMSKGMAANSFTGCFPWTWSVTVQERYISALTCA